MRPMLGDLELEQVQQVQADEDQILTRHPVPALEGDFLQRLGRRGARVTLTGVLTAPEVGESLEALREKLHAAEPVDFVADIATATTIDQVLIQDMQVRELAGQPNRVEYSFTLREYTVAQPVETEPVEVPPEPIPEFETGRLQVTVVVEGEPGFDFSNTTVTVKGTQEEDGSPLERALTNRTGPNVWREERFPPGQYTVEVLAQDGDALSGTADARVRGGEETAVLVTLRRGAKIATGLVIHFRFDSAFIEPCMRPVLRQVAQYAVDHPDEKLVIVGHTDLVGTVTYNQALSERRARSAFAFLTFGQDATASVNEWNELRRSGALNRDSWGRREYEQMLQDLGFFTGQIERDPAGSDAAVREFQTSQGLTADGDVGDATWPVLIREYLAQDSLAVPPGQLLENKADGCDEGPLRWMGCSEEDPVLNTENAWRPNRRTEFLFTKETTLPCKVQPPVTLALGADGAGGGGWCLDSGGSAKRCCFVTPADKPCPDGENELWCRRPAEPGSFVVRLELVHDDGSPVPDQPYVLTAPDGEFMNGEKAKTQGSSRAGTPVEGRTGADGTFTYDRSGEDDNRRKGPGIFTVRVCGDVVARAAGEPVSAARGPTACVRADPSGNPQILVVRVVVTSRAAVGVQPSITGPAVVVVRKPHTNPARQPVVLRASTAFTGSGAFTRSNDRVRFFTAPLLGTEITFDGSDNVFTSAQLAAGHTIFADGSRASAVLNDVTLTLTLTVGGQQGLSATHEMTAVELTLDVGLSRPAGGGAPPVMSAADKANPGRALQAQDALRNAARAMLIVRPPQPAAFNGTLTLAPLNGRVRLFNTEAPAPADVPVGTPLPIPTAGIPVTGLQLFAEGVTASAIVRDAGFQLGIQGLEPDGDRVAMTVVEVAVIANPVAAAPAVTAVQVGLWDNAFNAATGALRNAAAAANNFVDLDTRNFHFRVRDVRANNEVTVGWITEFDNGDPDDDRQPAPIFSDALSLTETAAGSGVFISRAVMVVTDDDDEFQDVDSGLPAGHADTGVRTVIDSNHRLRRINVDGTRQLVSHVRGRYQAAAGLNPFSARVPVFERNPEERRRMRIHLVDVRSTVGGTGILPILRQFTVEDTIRSIYAVCGIFAEIDVIEIDPPASTIGWVAAYPTDPIAADPSVVVPGFNGTHLTPTQSNLDVFNAVRARPDFDADDIYLVMVRRIYRTPPPPPGPGLASAAGGIAFADFVLPANSPGRSFAFVAIDSGITEFADPHEATHNTWNFSHYDLQAATATAPGNIDGKNLMHRFFLANNLSTSNPKRLWNTAVTNNLRAPPLVLPAQIDRIRASRFTRPY